MTAITLSDAERLALSRVLELRLGLSRKSTPMLLPLSFYSSELKGTGQIAKSLKAVKNGGPLSENETSRARYFNSLFNQGLIEGSAASPKLTGLAQYYLDAVDQGANDEFWKGEGGDGVELNVIRELAQRLAQGSEVSETFKQIWFNVQTVFDYIPDSELESLLKDKNKLLFIFRINSNGWEVGRYFRLTEAERQDFQVVYTKVLSADALDPSSEIEFAAAKYKSAADAVQADVRFRISGFLNAYSKLRDELASGLPRLDSRLNLRRSLSDTAGAINRIGNPSYVSPAEPLQSPRQIIVTGCPGSGKSYYINQLIDRAACKVFRTQFHPETSYFDFVGAYKPQPVYGAKDPSSVLLEASGIEAARGRPFIDYRYVPGPLIQAVGYALEHPSENVILLIEELNRGNSASIFGDILLLLDRADSGESRYGVSIGDDLIGYFARIGFGVDELRLPSNLYLWATMNNADQGVFPLDTAFRRRWEYVYMGYGQSCGYKRENTKLRYGGRQYHWDDFRGIINNHLISLNVHEDKLIGPYFLTEDQISNPDAVLEKLFLYLWDDVLRFRQESLFVEKSFSMVTGAWKDGDGSPLKLDVAILEATDSKLPISDEEQVQSQSVQPTPA